MTADPTDTAPGPVQLSGRAQPYTDPLNPDARQAAPQDEEAGLTWEPDDAARPRTPRPDVVPSRHTAICPVAGCGSAQRREGDPAATACVPQQLPIRPELAYDTYTCPCPRRALLDVGLTAQKTWVLTEHKATQDQRAEMNMIAHALLAPQTRDRERPRARRLDTSADATSDHLGRAHLAAHRLYRQAGEYVLAGHFQRAAELVQQARAAEFAYTRHERAYRRVQRAAPQEARWQHASLFFIQFDPPQPGDRPQPVAVGAPGYHPTFTFEFTALWNEQAGRFEVDNAADIERASGLEVGADGWRDLMALLQYLRGESVNGEAHAKSGTKIDPRYPIYREDRGSLVLRSFIDRRYPRARTAMEALRRTLVHESGAPAEGLPDPDWLEDVLAEPEWSQDQLAAPPSRPRRVRSRPVSAPPHSRG